MLAKITVNMDNAAFEGQHTFELARILRDLADRIEGHPHCSPGHCQPLRDFNENEVGWFDVLDPSESAT